MDIKIGLPSNLKIGYKIYEDYDATEPLAFDESDNMTITLEKSLLGFGMSALALAGLVTHSIL